MFTGLENLVIYLERRIVFDIEPKFRQQKGGLVPIFLPSYEYFHQFSQMMKKTRIVSSFYFSNVIHKN